MICEDYQKLVDSVLYRGSSIHGKNREDVVQLHPWYGYLYISEFVDERDKYKIGITTRLKDRSQQLQLANIDQDSSRIRYIWALPINQEVESAVKFYLRPFTIQKDNTLSGKTETFYGIEFNILIWTVRLVILHTFTSNRGYLNTMDGDAMKAATILGKYFNTERIDRVYLCEDDKVYSGKKEWDRTKRPVGVYKPGDIVGIPYNNPTGRSGQVYYPAVIDKKNDDGGWTVRFFKIREGVTKDEIEEAMKRNKEIKKDIPILFSKDGELEGKINKETLDKTNLFLIREAPPSDDVESEDEAESEEEDTVSEQTEEKQTEEYGYKRELDLGYIFCRLESETGVDKGVLMDIKGFYEYIPNEYINDDELDGEFDDNMVSDLKI